MDEIKSIRGKLARMLLSLGFKETTINGETNYVLGNTYCIPQHVQTLGFLMEYAHSEEEAAKNWHGDGDKFPFDMGEDAILAGIKAEVIGNTPELRQAETPLPLAV